MYVCQMLRAVQPILGRPVVVVPKGVIKPSLTMMNARSSLFIHTIPSSSIVTSSSMSTSSNKRSHGMLRSSSSTSLSSSWSSWGVASQNGSAFFSSAASSPPPSSPSPSGRVVTTTRQQPQQQPPILGAVNNASSSSSNKATPPSSSSSSSVTVGNQSFSERLNNVWSQHPAMSGGILIIGDMLSVSAFSALFAATSKLPPCLPIGSSSLPCFCHHQLVLIVTNRFYIWCIICYCICYSKGNVSKLSLIHRKKKKQTPIRYCHSSSCTLSLEIGSHLWHVDVVCPLLLGIDINSTTISSSCASVNSISTMVPWTKIHYINNTIIKRRITKTRHTCTSCYATLSCSIW
jgi:hypothetical protein